MTITFELKETKTNKILATGTTPQEVNRFQKKYKRMGIKTKIIMIKRKDVL